MVNRKVILGIVFCIIVPGILQWTGFIKDEWAKDTSISYCQIVRLRGNAFEKDYVAAYVLELLPFLAIIFFFAAVLISTFEFEAYGWNWLSLTSSYLHWMLATLFDIIYPISGILTLVGCIAISKDFSYSDLGPSFHYCITAGCFHILGMLYILYNICFSNRYENLSDEYMDGENGNRMLKDTPTDATLSFRNIRMVRLLE